MTKLTASAAVTALLALSAPAMAQNIIVVAHGENHDLKTGFGTSAQAPIKPCAYNNPIFVDIDGNGFQPNGDNLGWPLPVKGLSVEAVKAKLDSWKKSSK